MRRTEGRSPGVNPVRNAGGQAKPRSKSRTPDLPRPALVARGQGARTNRYRSRYAPFKLIAVQYLRISRTISIAGLLLVVAGQFTPTASPGIEIVGAGVLILGLVTYRLSRRKRLELESHQEGST